MIDNQKLKTKLKSEFQKLKLNNEQEDAIVRELNYLSNLLIDIYIKKTQDVKR